MSKISVKKTGFLDYFHINVIQFERNRCMKKEIWKKHILQEFVYNDRIHV